MHIEFRGPADVTLPISHASMPITISFGHWIPTTFRPAETLGHALASAVRSPLLSPLASRHSGRSYRAKLRVARGAQGIPRYRPTDLHR